MTSISGMIWDIEPSGNNIHFSRGVNVFAIAYTVLNTTIIVKKLLINSLKLYLPLNHYTTIIA
jgi:hypothetical protein